MFPNKHTPLTVERERVYSLCKYHRHMERKPIFILEGFLPRPSSTLAKTSTSVHSRVSPIFLQKEAARTWSIIFVSHGNPEYCIKLRTWIGRCNTTKNIWPRKKETAHSRQGLETIRLKNREKSYLHFIPRCTVNSTKYSATDQIIIIQWCRSTAKPHQQQFSITFKQSTPQTFVFSTIHNKSPSVHMCPN